jgi:hypothetical protein
VVLPSLVFPGLRHVPFPGFQNGLTSFVTLESDPIKKISFFFRPVEKDSFVLVNFVVGSDNVTLAVKKQQVRKIPSVF